MKKNNKKIKIMDDSEKLFDKIIENIQSNNKDSFIKNMQLLDGCNDKKFNFLNLIEDIFEKTNFIDEFYFFIEWMCVYRKKKFIKNLKSFIEKTEKYDNDNFLDLICFCGLEKDFLKTVLNHFDFYFEEKSIFYKNRKFLLSDFSNFFILENLKEEHICSYFSEKERKIPFFIINLFIKNIEMLVLFDNKNFLEKIMVYYIEYKEEVFLKKFVLKVKNPLFYQKEASFLEKEYVFYVKTNWTFYLIISLKFKENLPKIPKVLLKVIKNFL